MRVTRRIIVSSSLLGSLIQTPGIAQHPIEIAPHNIAHQTQEVDRKAGSVSKSKHVTLSLRDSTILHALQEITRQTGVRFTFDSRLDALKKRITLNVNNLPIEDVVSRLLKETGLSAQFSSNGTIAVLGHGNSKEHVPVVRQDTQTFVLTGRVIDSTTREGISGVTISVAGTALSTVTSGSGEYTLRGVRSGQWTVIAKLFGYRAETRAITISDKARPVANFTLVAMATSLSGVVTTVTGAQQKLEIGNAITTINVDSVMQVAPVSSLTDLLEHRVPGLAVLRGSGQPGDPARLRLRGASSINSSNEMIVVVDGVRVDADPKAFAAASFGNSTGGMTGYLGSSPFDLIDPNTIETIDVFKGPSAAAMYGSDAANGVLVITTKRGRPGPTVMTAIVTRGLSYMPGKYPPGVYSYGWTRNLTLGNIQYGRCMPANLSNPCLLDRTEKYQALNEPYYTVLGRGETESYSLTASGGAPTAQYSFTGSASSEIGLIKMSEYLIERYQSLQSEDMPRWMRRPDDYRMMMGTGQIASQLKPNLLVRITTGASSSNQRKAALGNSAIRIFSRLSRDQTIDSAQDRFYERMYRRTSSITYTAQLNWMVRERIRVTANAGYNTTNVVDETMLPAGLAGHAFYDQKDGVYSNGRQLSQQRTANANSEIPAFQERIRLIVGGTYNGSANESFSISSRNVPQGVTRPSTFDQGGTINTASISTIGWYIEPRLNLHSRFFVMPGFRLDNNGLRGKNAGAFLLPKLNLSWVLSDEGFFPWKDGVSLLRLRLAGGVAGTQPGISDRLRLIGVLPDASQATDALGFTSLGNTKLQPERSTEFEGGVDIDVWNGRAGIVYTLYNKVRYDAIERVPLAPSVTLNDNGFAQNIGTIKNTGHEVEFRLTPIERGAVAWTTNGAVAINDNRIVSLRAGLLPMIRLSGDPSQGWWARAVEGYPLWGAWARPVVGYADVDQDGIISTAEVTLADSTVYLGQPEPKGTLSWSNNLRFFAGRLSFNTMMSYNWGMMQVASYMRSLDSPFSTLLNKPNPSLEEQAFARAITLTAYPIAQTVNTIRLQSVSLNFVVPPHLARRLQGKSLSVSLQGSNLWMHSNYLGKDPNVGSIRMMNGITEDSGLIPQPRKWQLRFQWGN